MEHSLSPDRQNVSPAGGVGEQLDSATEQGNSNGNGNGSSRNMGHNGNGSVYPLADGGRPATPGENPTQTTQSRPPVIMTGTGRLVFQVTTARGAIPLQGAQVTVRDFNEEGTTGEGVGDGDTRFILYSGADGRTETVDLPAPARSLSLEAAPPDQPLPYALYNAQVVLSGYYIQNYSRIPLFDGITSVQQADLIPLPENGIPDGFTADQNRFTEGQSPDL